MCNICGSNRSLDEVRISLPRTADVWIPEDKENPGRYQKMFVELMYIDSIETNDYIDEDFDGDDGGDLVD